jgi:hypothetical protein
MAGCTMSELEMMWNKVLMSLLGIIILNLPTGTEEM